MAFMEQQITAKMTWYVVETSQGTDYYPGDLFSRDEVSANDEEISEIQGYGARMSAPGYMDCTEWSVFDTPEEAQAYLDEYYGDDDDEEQDEE